MLVRLARFCYRRRWIVLGIWVALLVALNAASGAVGTDYHTEFNQPDSESKQVQDALTAGGNEADAGFPASIVFSADQGNAGSGRPGGDDRALRQVKAMDGVNLTSPYDAGRRAAQQPGGSADEHARARRLLRPADDHRTRPGGDPGLRRRRSTTIGDKVEVPGLQITYGGQVFQKFEFPASELLGVLAAIIILLIAFGSVIAMGLPIGTALVGLGIGMAIVGLASHVFSMPEFGPQMTAMIGLGVGIDYALFIVTRYREHLHAGEDPETATSPRSTPPAGRCSSPASP